MAAEHDLGPVDSLETEAVGAPGQRRFRLRLLGPEHSASLWLEKEQVVALATAIQQLLAQHRRPGDGLRPAPPELGVFPLNPSLDFRVGRLALAYDETADRLALYVTDADADGGESPTLEASFTRRQALLFAVQADATVEAGRPLCPLCKTPLDGDPHLCPPANGHSDDALAWIEPPEIA